MSINWFIVREAQKMVVEAMDNLKDLGYPVCSEIAHDLAFKYVLKKYNSELENKDFWDICGYLNGWVDGKYKTDLFL